MHNYAPNSPQAAARLLALSMIADGNVCRSEVDAVRQLNSEAALGLPPGGLASVLQTLCEDLLYSAQSHGSLTACIDNTLLESLIRDVDDPALQRKVVEVITATAFADGHLADGERIVLEALHRCWNAAPGVSRVRVQA